MAGILHAQAARRLFQAPVQLIRAVPADGHEPQSVVSVHGAAERQRDTRRRPGIPHGDADQQEQSQKSTQSWLERKGGWGAECAKTGQAELAVKWGAVGQVQEPRRRLAVAWGAVWQADLATWEGQQRAARVPRFGLPVHGHPQAVRTRQSHEPAHRHHRHQPIGVQRLLQGQKLRWGKRIGVGNN